MLLKRLHCITVFDATGLSLVASGAVAMYLVLRSSDTLDVRSSDMIEHVLLVAHLTPLLCQTMLVA